MKTVEDFEPFVVAYAPYTPTDILQHAIRESIVDFMHQTKIALDVIELETQEKVADYMLDFPDCRRFLGVKKVEQTRAYCSGGENWETMFSGDGGNYEIILRKGTHPIIVLADPHKKPHRIRIEYYWSIARDDCEIPDFIYEDYMSAIVAGALIRLATMPEHEHLARALQLHERNWFDGVQKAKMEKTRGKPKHIIGSPFLRRRGSFSWR